jgi:ketosteroid isomerase-like protein
VNVHVDNHLVSLAEAAAQLRELEGSYLVHEAVVNGAGAICFVTASVGARAITEAEAEPREMRMLAQWGWKRHKRGVWYRALGTFAPL